MDKQMQQAIAAHREMWRGIAAECRRQKHQVYKMDYIKTHGLDENMENYDPLCDYISKQYTKAKRVVSNPKTRKKNGENRASDCIKFCPFDFGQGDSKKMSCSSREPLGGWAEVEYTDWETAARIAEEIASMPLRKEFCNEDE